MINVLLTGGSGFIGYSFTLYLRTIGFNVGWIGRNETSADVAWIEIDCDLEINIKRFKPDYVVHLAAVFDNNNVTNIVECNITLPLRILEAIKDQENAKFIYIGSYWQFGDKKTPGIPIDLYSSTKSSFSKYVDYYHEYHNVNAIELVLYGTYGPTDRRMKILDLLIHNALNSNELSLSPGEQQLNLVHVDDICDAIFKCFERLNMKSAHEHFGVFSDNEYNLIELSELVSRVLGIQPNVDFGAKDYRDIEIFTPIYNYEIVPGWTEVSSIETYLKQFIK